MFHEIRSVMKRAFQQVKVNYSAHRKRLLGYINLCCYTKQLTPTRTNIVLASQQNQRLSLVFDEKPTARRGFFLFFSDYVTLIS